MYYPLFLGGLLTIFLSQFGIYTELYFGVDRGGNYYANGWVYTRGLYGVREWNGSFLGKIDLRGIFTPDEQFYIGVRLFVGTLIEGNDEEDVSSYLGVASHVHFW